MKHQLSVMFGALLQCRLEMVKKFLNWFYIKLNTGPELSPLGVALHSFNSAPELTDTKCFYFSQQPGV